MMRLTVDRVRPVGDTSRFDRGRYLVDDVGKCNLDGLTGCARRELDHAGSDTLWANGDTPRNTGEFGVGKLHTCPGVSIVEDDIDTALA